MRKMLILLVAFGLLLLLSTGAFAAVSLKAGVEPSGTLDSVYSTTNNFNFSTSDSKSVANSFYVGGEMTRRTSDGLTYGGGIEYQLYRKAEGADNSFNFVPVYGLLRKDFQISLKNRAFVFGRLGYNFYQEDNPADGFNLHGGLYYAAGAGVTLSGNVELQLIYSCNQGEAESAYLDIEHTYTKIGLGLGIRL